MVASYDTNQLGEYVASNGNALWKDTLEFPVGTIPTVGGNTVFLAYYNSNNITAVSLSTGRSLWNFTAVTKNEILNAAPAYSNGNLFFGTLNGTVYALTSTGHKLWTANLQARIESTPAVAHGLVFLGADNGRLYALNATTGLTTWEFPSSSKPAVGAFQASPAVSANGLVYDGSNDTRVYAVTMSNGFPVWNYTTSAPITSSPALNDGYLFVVNTKGNVTAFNDSARQFEFDWADCSNDGKVDIIDIVCVAACFAQNSNSILPAPVPSWATCKYSDFFLEGKITIRDLVKVASLFSQVERPPFPGEGQATRVMDPVWPSQCSFLPPDDRAYCLSRNGYADH